MHLDKTIPLAVGAGAAAGALMAPKATDLPEGTPPAVGTAVATGGIVCFLLAFLAPKYPKTIGAISLASGIIDTYARGLNLGAAGALGIGGALLAGNPQAHEYAALGLYALGGADLGQGVLVAKRLSEYNALPLSTRNMLRGAAANPAATPPNV